MLIDFSGQLMFGLTTSKTVLTRGLGVKRAYKSSSNCPYSTTEKVTS